MVSCPPSFSFRLSPPRLSLLALAYDQHVQAAMKFVIPVDVVDYNGQKYQAAMGPFEHSPEREFALTVNKKAIDDCSSLDQLKPVARNLLEGWSSMHTAIQGLMLENIQLRQALAKKNLDLDAAEELMTEASREMERMTRKYAKQSTRAKWSLWPWQS